MARVFFFVSERGMLSREFLVRLKYGLKSIIVFQLANQRPTQGKDVGLQMDPVGRLSGSAKFNDCYV